MNCQPGKLLINFLCSLHGLLGPKMLCLFRLSQCSLGPSPCRGPQVRLLCSGGLLLRSGGLLLRLLWSGGLQLRHGGLQLRCGGLLPCLLCTGGLQSRPLRPGGLQSRPLRPGGLQFCSVRLCPGFPLCLNPQSLHFHMDLALRPSPCSASAPPPSWIVLERLEAAPCGGALS